MDVDTICAELRSVVFPSRAALDVLALRNNITIYRIPYTVGTYIQSEILGLKERSNDKQLHAVSRIQQGRSREACVKTIRSLPIVKFSKHYLFSG